MLGMIVTPPDYRRRGAASLVVRWGIDRADERGVEIYLESSMAHREAVVREVRAALPQGLRL